MSDGEETWRHVITDQSQRHLPDTQYYSLPRQVGSVNPWVGLGCVDDKDYIL